MKKALVLVVAMVIAAGLWFILKSKNTEAPVPVATGHPAVTAVSGNSSSAPTATNAMPTVPAPAPLVSIPEVNISSSTNADASPAPPAASIPSLPPLTILDNARMVIHNYQDRFGENPVGDNSEITAALMGNNPKHLNFITEESGLRVNDKGELIDAWGTPFFFHQISGKIMEIHSAGEDRKMWTFDDQVTR